MLEDIMQHKSRDQIRDVVEMLPSYLRAGPLSKRERLETWAEALEREGGRRLRTLYEIEYAPTDMRARLRADDSPLSVAFGNPRLRAEGLAGDTIGDAAAFFGISESELHYIVCFCRSGETMSADKAAARVRYALAREVEHKPIRALWLVSGLMAALTAIGILPL
jgi:hypothetical protein